LQRALCELQKSGSVLDAGYAEKLGRILTPTEVAMAPQNPLFWVKDGIEATKTTARVSLSLTLKA
jgi:hypothetical protein